MLVKSGLMGCKIVVEIKQVFVISVNSLSVSISTVNEFYVCSVTSLFHMICFDTDICCMVLP
jgi:hypothetical protein